MPKSISLIPYFKKNGYLLLIAALLFGASYIIDYFRSGSANVTAIENKFTDYLQSAQIDFEAVNSNNEFVNTLYDDQLSASQMNMLKQKKYFLFFYNVNTIDSSKLIQWNTQAILPTQAILRDTGKLGFSQLANGYYVWFKQFNSRGFSIGLLPIKWNYIVTNEYLKNDFTIEGILTSYYNLIPNGNVKDIHGKSLFGLQEIAGVTVQNNNIFSVLIKILATFLIFIFIYFLAIFLLQSGYDPLKVFIYFFIRV